MAVRGSVRMSLTVLCTAKTKVLIGACMVHAFLNNEDSIEVLLLKVLNLDARS